GGRQVDSCNPAVAHRSPLLIFTPRRDEMAPERRDVRQVCLIAYPAAAVVIVEIVAAIAADAARAKLRGGRRVESGQILGDRIETQQIAFGIGRREALAPTPCCLIFQSGVRAASTSLSTLLPLLPT